MKKAFSRFFVTDTLSWYGERGVRIKAEEDGRMFPVTDSSETIIQCLLKEADLYNVSIRTNAELKTVTRQDSGKWKLELTGGELLADYLCIAAGGYAQNLLHATKPEEE